MGFLISTIHFTCNTRSDVKLPQIVRAIEINVRITIWISSQCCLINCRSIILLCYTVITAGLIVESHVAIGIQILRIRNGNIDSHRATNIYTHRRILTTFGSDKDNPLRRTTTIERYGSGIFQHRHTLYFCSSDIAGTTRYTVN